MGSRATDDGVTCAAATETASTGQGSSTLARLYHAAHSHPLRSPLPPSACQRSGSEPAGVARDRHEQAAAGAGVGRVGQHSAVRLEIVTCASAESDGEKEGRERLQLPERRFCA
eukprot:2174053-Rhodomonas_salina.6